MMRVSEEMGRGKMPPTSRLEEGRGEEDANPLVRRKEGGRVF